MDDIGKGMLETLMAKPWVAFAPATPIGKVVK